MDWSKICPKETPYRFSGVGTVGQNAKFVSLSYRTIYAGSVKSPLHTLLRLKFAVGAVSQVFSNLRLVLVAPWFDTTGL